MMHTHVKSVYAERGVGVLQVLICVKRQKEREGSEGEREGKREEETEAKAKRQMK